MTVTFYKTNDDPRKLNKTLTSISTYKISLKDENNILNPTLLFATLSIPAGTNYLYIKEFNRYYFITNTKIISNTLSEISCKVDVLYTYRDTINASTVVAERTSNKYNRYIPDTIPTLAKYRNIYKLFTLPALGLPFDSAAQSTETNSVLLTVLKGG